MDFSTPTLLQPGGGLNATVDFSTPALLQPGGGYCNSKFLHFTTVEFCRVVKSNSEFQYSGTVASLHPLVFNILHEPFQCVLDICWTRVDIMRVVF